MHRGKVIDNVSGYEIIDCEACGFVHIDPIPAQDELNKVYREEYYTEEKPLFIQQQIEDLEWWNVVYDDRYDLFEQKLSNEKRRILDIGCGPGFFLKRGEERGWKGLGIEPSKQAAQHAQSLGVEVLNVLLHEAGLEDRDDKFDVIHMSEVLEHLPDPLSVCTTAYNLLNDGGILCVVVPNDYNPFQVTLRENHGFQPYWLAPPHHINYFTYNSLQRLLEGAGLNLLRKEATFPIDLFLMMGDNYIGNDTVGRASHAKRKKLEVNLKNGGLNEFKRELYQFLADRNIGREIILYMCK